MTTTAAFFAELDANGWVLVIGAIFFGIIQLYSMYLDHERGKLAATKVEEVAGKANDAAAVLKGIANTGEKTHILVNNQHGAALRALAVALRTIATDRPTEMNLSAADAAERADDEHHGRQKTVDRILGEDKKPGEPPLPLKD